MTETPIHCYDGPTKVAPHMPKISAGKSHEIFYDGYCESCKCKLKYSEYLRQDGLLCPTCAHAEGK